MKKRRNFLALDIALIMLLLTCIVLAVLLFVAKPAFLPVAGALLLLILAFCFVFLQKLRRVLRSFLQGGKVQQQAAIGWLGSFSLPALALQKGRIIWYNTAFAKELADESENCLVLATKLLPCLDIDEAIKPKGQDVFLKLRRYTAYGNRILAEDELVFIVFAENTAIKNQAEEYIKSRPVVMYFSIDTYDEILKEMKESQRAAIMSGIDAIMEGFVGQGTGFLRRVSSSRYLAVIEERHLKEMLTKRFDILDEARKIGTDGSVTISIGVGRLYKSIKECEEMARQALDMALGRGGDQAAVKSPEGFSFYGGVSRSVEKRTKVKSRIVAFAIRDIIKQYHRVLIMGHKNSDMDSLGAAIGMLRFCRICQKPAAIVINQKASLAQSLLQLLCGHGYEDDFISPEEALSLTGAKTLVVVVDTHARYLLESQEVFDASAGAVVIDHHRRVVNHIDNALLFYHEPSASSASELVCEMLQYVAESAKDKPTQAEAEAMLAGITLDTRTFSLHVGVRTFEAAAYLRRLGAQTESVKALFASSMDQYLYKSHLVAEAKIHCGCAVSVSQQVPFECEVVAPQAANELLSIENVMASFVAILNGGQARVSARSMGGVNVQLVMEKIGGGGHLTMAGAQLENVDVHSTAQLISDAISEYMQENEGAKKQPQHTAKEKA